STAKTTRDAGPAMPGPPFGPMPRTTSTCPGLTSPRSTAAIASGPLSYTIAGPVNVGRRAASRTPSVTIALSGASDPCRITSGVVKRDAREDVPRLQILPDHLADPRAGSPREIEHLRTVGQHRRAAGQRHAECFADDVHGVGGAHARTDAGTADCVIAHAAQIL